MTIASPPPSERPERPGHRGGETGEHRVTDDTALLRCARDPNDPLTIAFSGVIGRALAAGQRPLIRGLSEEEFCRLLQRYFPDALLENGTDTGGVRAGAAGDDELGELFALLREYRRDERRETIWLARAIASAAMRDNHLWQDMGLPNRAFLSRLMRDWFPDLSARNVGDMKWKKFFYRQLCERAGVPICKSPNCADCVDFRVCFGPETGDAPPFDVPAEGGAGEGAA